MGFIGSAVAGIALWLGAGTAAAAAIGLAVNIGLAAASAGVSIKSARDQRKAAKRAQMESQQRNAYRNFRQPLTPRRIIYGRTRVAGPILFAHNRGKKQAHIVIGIAGHEIDAFEKFHLLKDELVVDVDPLSESYGRVAGKYTNAIIIWPFRGTATQNIGQKMRTALDVRPNGKGETINLLSIIQTTDRFAGIAAMYVVTHAFGINFEGQSPDFAATVRGKRVYDPRTELTEWSANPALCAADYLVSYMGFSWGAIDETALIAAANICDELVLLKKETPEAEDVWEKRYECNGVLGAETSHADNLDILASAMAGAVRYSSGLWIIEAGAPKNAELILDESMVLGSYSVAFGTPDRALPNAVRGNFIDSAEWQPTSYPGRELSESIAAEGATNWLEIDLPLTTSHSMAQRIAKIELLRARAGRSLSLDFDLRGLQARPGDVILYSAPDLGLEDAQFEVDGFTFSRTVTGEGMALTCRLDLIDYNPDVYDWDPEGDELALVRGTVEIDAVRNKFFSNLTVDERSLATAPKFSADYVYATTGQQSAKTIKKVTLTVEVLITTTNGVDTAQQTAFKELVVPTQYYTAKSYTVPITANYPNGHSYVSHDLIAATIQGLYTDNTTTEVQYAGLIVGLP